MDTVMKISIIAVEIILAVMVFGFCIPDLVKNFKNYTRSQKFDKIFFIVIVFLVIFFGIGIWNLCF